jgi:hypothetical protein
MTVCAFDPGDVVAVFGEADGRELMRLAEADLRTRLDILRASLAGGDRPGATRAAHSLAGVSGNVMATTLSDLARELEHVLRTRDGAVPEVLLERLVLEADGVFDAMTGFLRPGGPGDVRLAGPSR